MEELMEEEPPFDEREMLTHSSMKKRTMKRMMSRMRRRNGRSVYDDDVKNYMI
jgi:hypothetical protein